MSASNVVELRSERFVRVLRECIPRFTLPEALRAYRLNQEGCGAREIGDQLQYPQYKLQEFFDRLDALERQQPTVYARLREIERQHDEGTAASPAPVPHVPERPKARPAVTSTPIVIYRDGDVQLFRAMHPPGPDVPLTPLQEATVRLLLKQGIPRGHISGLLRLPVDQILRIGAN